jgi:hypothetical protein
LSVTIYWVTPTDLVSTSTYKINIYESQIENGDYTLVSTIDAKVNGADIASVSLPSGNSVFYYYVRYFVSPSGGESTRVLAWMELSVKEQRLSERVLRNLPRDITVKLGNNTREIKDMLVGAVNSINILQPNTSYVLDNIPVIWETVVVLGATILLYSQQYLNIAITDFSYGENGLSLNRDRGTKMGAAMDKVLVVYNELAKSVKFADYPNGIGLGSFSLSTPQARVMGFLFDVH